MNEEVITPLDILKEIAILMDKLNNRYFALYRMFDIKVKKKQASES